MQRKMRLGLFCLSRWRSFHCNRCWKTDLFNLKSKGTSWGFYVLFFPVSKGAEYPVITLVYCKCFREVFWRWTVGCFTCRPIACIQSVYCIAFVIAIIIHFPFQQWTCTTLLKLSSLFLEWVCQAFQSAFEFLHRYILHRSLVSLVFICNNFCMFVCTLKHSVWIYWQHLKCESIMNAQIHIYIINIFA